MKTIVFLFIWILAGLNASAQSDEVFAKFPDYHGFSKKYDQKIYVPDDLWDYINGAADAYLGFGFTDLHMADYKKGKKLSIRVEIYRHSNRDNAFGIYANERFPEYNFNDIGVQGYQQGDVLNFFTDVYYVKIFSSAGPEKAGKAMNDIAGLLAAKLGGSTGFPEAFNYFPEEGRVKNKESFASVNFMGYSFYNSVFVSEYLSDGNAFRIFYLSQETPEDCKRIITRHLEQAQQPVNTVNPGITEINDPYNGKIRILWKDNVIWGIIDLKDDAVAGRYLNLLFK